MNRDLERNIYSEFLKLNMLQYYYYEHNNNPSIYSDLSKIINCVLKHIYG